MAGGVVLHRMLVALQCVVYASCDEGDGSPRTRGTRARLEGSFTQQPIEIAIVCVEKEESPFHRDPLLSLSSESPAASQMTVVYRAIDSRLRPSASRFDISPARHVSLDRKCHRPARYNSPVE